MTLLYDNDGLSYKEKHLLKKLENLIFKEKKLVLSFRADYIHVYYTPDRRRFLDSKDLREVVGKWKLEASFRLQGVQD